MRSDAHDDEMPEDAGRADEFHRLEQSYVREERWEDLAGLLIERTENVADAAGRSHYLMRAAQIFETNLADPDRAFITLLAAFQEDPANDELATDLARVATAHNRWRDLLAECNSLVAGEMAPESKRAEMLVAMAGWYQRDLDDAAAAEQSLEAAIAANPANLAALNSLVTLYSQRGDWSRVATYLTTASASTSDPLARVQFAFDAAEICRSYLGDMDAAAEQYSRVLELSPGHPQATAALAEIAWGRKDWAVALPLLEALAEAAEQALEPRARLWQRAGWSAQMTGDVERARVNYRRAHAAEPEYLPTLLCWSQLAEAQGWWQDVRTTVPLVLAQAEAKLTAVDRAEHLMALGQAHMELGAASAAAGAFMKALELAPDLPDLREALAEASAMTEGRGPSDATALIEQNRVLLAGAASADERFEILCRIGRLQREELNDQRAAQETFEQALTLRPHDPETLHELMEIYTLLEQWRRAVNVLEQLVETESGKDKARYLVAIANILNYELQSPVEAVELYDQALDEDPDDRRSFERIERILSSQQDWRELARAYRHMIKRLGASPPADKRAYLLALWRGLAEISRVRQADLAAAAAALEVCVSLAPEDNKQREALVEVYEAQGAGGFAGAVKLREQLLAAASDAEGAAQQIRALAGLYGEHQRYDGAFCACAALCALMKANTQEKAFYAQHALPGVPLAKAGLSEGLWQGWVCTPRQDRRISQLLAAVSGGVTISRAKDAQAWGLDISHRVDLTRDNSSVSQILAYVSRLIGVSLPAVYVPPTAPDEIDLVILLEGKQVLPAFVLGGGLVTGRTDRELAFRLAKKLVGLRADHFLLWPQVVPTQIELRVILAAAIKLLRPEFDLPDTDPAAVRKYVSFLHKVLPQSQLISMNAAVEQLVADPASIDLGAWAAAAEENANRAGLLACGDVVAVARELVKEARARRGRPEEAILGLARWSVTTQHLELREQLGLALVVDARAAEAASISLRTGRRT
jgi:tetratricopeptide (TPR) repeat protein